MKQRLQQRSFILLCLTVLLPVSSLTSKVKTSKVISPSPCSNSNPCVEKELKCPPAKKFSKGYDFIIVGLGSAGSILARKLSEPDAHGRRKRVLALETGVNVQKDPVILNPMWVDNANTLIYSPKYALNYPVPIGFLQSTLYAEGLNWGGSASHNFLLAGRGTPDIYDFWSTVSANKMWLYNNLLPKMKAVESYFSDGTPFDAAQRGSHGPISVTQNPPIGMGDVFLNNLSTITGTPFIPDYNDPKYGQIGISAIQQFITPGPNSHRSYSNLEFLPAGKGKGAVVSNSGIGLHGRRLKIISNARVLKFDINEDKYATGITYVFTGKEDKVLRASLNKGGKLILTAGAIRTPKLLFNSGVGPADELSAVGIPVVLDSPQVGKNLQCQYGSSAFIEGHITNMAQSFLSGSPYFPGDPSIRRIQVNYAITGADTFQALPWILDPQSLGSLTIVSNDPLIDLQINLPVYSNPFDASLIVAFYKIMKQTANAAGATVLFPPPQDFPAPFGPAPDDSALLADAASLDALVLQSHIVGTTRMGKSINDSVVSGKLKVHGLENVYIGDAGIQPKSVNTNPCFGVYYTALVLAEILGYPTPPAL